MKKLYLTLIAVLCVFGLHAQNELTNKVMMGYQGWFLAQSDSSTPNEWRHWFNSAGRTDPSAANIGVDMWPDMSEYTVTHNTNMTYSDGSNAALFSSHDLSTTRKHFEWMSDYNVHGVYLQRFLGEVQDNRFFQVRNDVLENVIAASTEYGRKFSIMYDISGVADDGTMLSKITDDWEYLIDTFDILNAPEYVHQDGKPVIAIWGIGFKNRGLTTATMQSIIDYFRNTHGMYVVGGVPSGWRTLSNDSETGSAWTSVYQSLDMISPWTVGRYGFSGVDSWKTSKIVPDLSDCNSRGKDYMPVIWPGFSWLNLHGGAFNQHPRYGGDFYWKQAYNAIDAGSDFIYVAMFDEVDEGTAMFKIAETEADLPTQLTSTLVTLDEDGVSLPSDWYLQLADETQKMLDGTTGISSTIPITPSTANGNGASFVSQSVPTTLTEGASFTATITMKNTGSTTWTKSNLYKLGSQNPQDNTTWGSTRIELQPSESVAPGAQVTFTLNGTAPASAGTYNFQWKMVQDNVEWFGATTDNLVITVGNIDYLDDCEALTGWGSSQSLSLSTDSQQGTNSLQFTGSTEMEFQKAFSPAYNGNVSQSDAILRFWYYVSDASKFTGVNQVELGSGGQADTDEFNWALPTLVNGWNLIDLNISAANQIGTPDINAIDWFRLYNFKSASVTTRLDAIQLIDPNQSNNMLDDCDALTDWGTAGSNSLSLDGTTLKQGSASIQMSGSGTNEFQKAFATAYNSGLTASNARLEFWYYVSDPSNMSTSNNQVEIGSGGVADVNEYHWKLSSFTTGWNFISLDVSAASTTGGTPDLNAINWFRIYNAKSGSVTNRIDEIKLVNNGGARATNIHEGGQLNDPKVTVYPNPASEFITIDLGIPQEQQVHASVYNLAGVRLLTHDFEQTDTSKWRLPIEGLEPGIHVLEIKVGAQRIVRRFFIK